MSKARRSPGPADRRVLPGSADRRVLPGQVESDPLCTDLDDRAEAHAAVAEFGRFAMASRDPAATVNRAVHVVCETLGSPVGALIRLLATDRLWLGVRDDSDRMPQRRPVDLGDLGGRGLDIVDRLAVTWRVTSDDGSGGKTVWLELADRSG